MNYRSLTAALFGATAFVSGAQADTLRYAIGWPPNTGATAAVERYAATAGQASGGDLEVKVYPLSLLNFLEANEGVRDGLADVVTILTPYFQNEFPHVNLATELASLVQLREDIGSAAPFVFSGALLEYVMLHCPECAAEVAAQNQVFTASGASPSYMLQCLTPVTTPEDLAGKRIRAGGAFWSRWVEAMGATTVSISINETFEALNQGVLDCSASNATELSNFSFKDVVKHISTDVPGAVFASSISNVNREVWQGLSAENRTALLKAGADVTAYMSWNYWEDAERNLKEAKENGIELLSASPELQAKSRAFIEADIDTIVATYKERFGIENGAETVETMRGLIEKWAGLASDAATADDLAKVYWDEVYAKIDVNAYGL